MIIELFGLPGTGKTTMAKRIEAAAGFKIVKISGRGELLWLNFIFFIKHPIKSAATLFFISVNSKNWKIFYYKFTNCFLHHNAKYQKALRFQKAVIDQGHFQDIISIFEKELKPEDLKNYLRYLVRPDILFIFWVAPDELNVRIEKRNYFTREDFGEDYRQNWFKNAQANDEIFRKIIKETNIPYVFLDAGKNIKEVQADILNSVSQKL